MGGKSPGAAARLAALEGKDAAGRFIHPDGVSAGVRSVILAWEAALEGQSLEEKATKHQELRTALDFYG